MKTATIRSLPATEPCPCCNGRGVQFAECAGGRGIPFEIRCDCCHGSGVVEAFPEPVGFTGDADLRVDEDVAAFWDQPRPAA